MQAFLSISAEIGATSSLANFATERHAYILLYVCSYNIFCLCTFSSVAFVYFACHPFSFTHLQLLYRLLVFTHVHPAYQLLFLTHLHSVYNSPVFTHLLSASSTCLHAPASCIIHPSLRTCFLHYPSARTCFLHQPHLITHLLPASSSHPH